MQYVHLALEIIGALTTILTAIGNAWPKGKVGAFCSKGGVVLRKVQAMADEAGVK